MINFDEELFTLAGKPFVDQNKVPLTLGKLACECLLADYDENTPAQVKYDRYKLARQVMKGGQFELIRACVDQIKDSLGRRCEPQLLGAAFEAMGE